MRTFAIVNRKGGVGKTTTAVNLAYVLATSCHLRVLLVDADGQANATQILLPRASTPGWGPCSGGMPSAMKSSLYIPMWTAWTCCRPPRICGPWTWRPENPAATAP